MTVDLVKNVEVVTWRLICEVLNCENLYIPKVIQSLGYSSAEKKEKEEFLETINPHCWKKNRDSIRNYYR